MAQSIRDKSEDRTRTHHSLPQDQALRGASVDLQLDGLWRVMGTKTHKKITITLRLMHCYIVIIHHL